MEVSQWIWRSPMEALGVRDSEVQWVLAFGSRAQLANPAWFPALRESFPSARLTGCSTAGEIVDTRVLDDTLCVTAIRFSRATVRLAVVPVTDGTRPAADRLAEQLPHEGLRHVLLLSDGLYVNGSELVASLRQHLPQQVSITGGLAGDGPSFIRTLVLADAPACEQRIAAIGLYGQQLTIGTGTLGGWDSFGPERRVTRAEGNVLHELDGQPALLLYKTYLGPEAAGLPATGLRFPLAILRPDEPPLVRTILSVDEDAGSMTFAGDVPVGSFVQLMKANAERLVEGALGAARQARSAMLPEPQLAILISCVGRKLVLKQRTEEEVEAVREVLGLRPRLCGFYSYGEIAPHADTAHSELHNQTMTITTLLESEG